MHVTSETDLQKNDPNKRQPLLDGGYWSKKCPDYCLLIPASILAFALGVGAFRVGDRFFAPETPPTTPPIHQPGPL